MKLHEIIQLMQTGDEITKLSWVTDTNLIMSTYGDLRLKDSNCAWKPYITDSLLNDTDWEFVREYTDFNTALEGMLKGEVWTYCDNQSESLYYINETTETLFCKRSHGNVQALITKKMIQEKNWYKINK